MWVAARGQPGVLDVRAAGCRSEARRWRRAALFQPDRRQRPGRPQPALGLSCHTWQQVVRHTTVLPAESVLSEPFPLESKKHRLVGPLWHHKSRSSMFLASMPLSCMWITPHEVYVLLQVCHEMDASGGVRASVLKSSRLL